MEILIISVFTIGYLFIALEHNIRIDKAAIALITGVLTWSIFVFYADHHFIDEELHHHLIEIGEIVFFLFGAMTIVELVDSHQGFRIITDKSILSGEELTLNYIINKLENPNWEFEYEISQ
mgnify:CR=1 FL=1